MKKTNRLITYTLSLLFLLQSVAWASGSMAPEAKLKLEILVEHMNHLSHAEKVSELKAMLAQRSAKDRAYLEKALGDIEKFSFPQLSLSGEAIVFQYGDKTINLKPEEGQTFWINNQKVDFSNGKFEDAALVLEKIFQEKNVSLMSLLLPEAHANSGMVVSLVGTVIALVGTLAAIFPIVVAGLAIAATGMVASYIIYDGQDKIFDICSKATKLMGEQKDSARLQDAEELIEKINQARQVMMSNKRCQTNRGDYVAICKSTSDCLKTLEVYADMSRTRAIVQENIRSIKEIRNSAPGKSPASSGGSAK